MRERREEAEAAVRDSQATLRSFYDNSSFLMGVLELEGDSIVKLYGNEATSAFLRNDASTVEGAVSAKLGVPL